MARVLVVEDDANNLDVASRIIRASGHEALVAVDGVAGLDLARVERPDAILVDLLLPRMGGCSSSTTRSRTSSSWRGDSRPSAARRRSRAPASGRSPSPGASSPT